MGKQPLIIMGDENSKGVSYFLKAAGELGCPARFHPLPLGKHLPLESGREGFAWEQLKGSHIKLDPPRYTSADILTGHQAINEYIAFLREFEQYGECRSLNEPAAIMDTLDKWVCKQRLQAAGVRTTPALPDAVRSSRQLWEQMRKRRWFKVFVKPRTGSGAGGVLAYQLHPVTGREVLYTSAGLQQGTLYNTKKLRRYEDPESITLILNRILKLGGVVEEWIPKAKHQGKSYDLRVVFQFGRIRYIVARLSEGPITNLHLNNGALAIAELGLTTKTMAAISELCRMAAGCFPGLRTAGMDILLTPGRLTPYIIEINAQGDLIYQDIFQDNSIYREQIEYMMGEMG